MKITASLGDLRGFLYETEGELAQDHTDALRSTMPEAKQDLRDQTLAGGLGQRMANTWRGDVYPKAGRSLGAAAEVRSKAPDIADAFERGATIHPINGAEFLWIPTKNTPRAGGRIGPDGKRRKGGAMLPIEVEDLYKSEFIFRRLPKGGWGAYIEVVTARSTKGGFRAPTSRRKAQGRTSKLVLMFTLKSSVTDPKLFDLNAVANKWADRYERAFTRNRG